MKVVTLHIKQAIRKIFKIEACQLENFAIAQHSERGNIVYKRILFGKPLLIVAVFSLVFMRVFPTMMVHFPFFPTSLLYDPKST